MSIPIAKMKKAEIVKLASRKCLAHSHSYLEHYSCYLKEVGVRERKVGMVDIEASNLDADFGIILSWCILDDESGEILEDVLTLADIEGAPAGQEDTRIVQSLIDCMLQFDLVVGFFSTRYDIPYIRTRALVDGVQFPPYGALNHKDVYYWARHKLKLSSNRQENVCRVLLGETEKTRVDSKYWRGAVRGDVASLDYVIDHNRKDVRDLQKIYHILEEYTMPLERSV